jgi:hypothetical protein
MTLRIVAIVSSGGVSSALDMIINSVDASKVSLAAWL